MVPPSDDALGTILGTPRHITSNFVFWRGNGERYTTFSGAFRKIAQRAEMPFRGHDLRHCFVSEAAQQTGDIAARQAILGHKAITITMRYFHPMTDHLHRVLERWSRWRRHNSREGHPAAVPRHWAGHRPGDDAFRQAPMAQEKNRSSGKCPPGDSNPHALADCGF